jgi:hypothetical protein
VLIETESLIRKILINELDLDANQIWLYNQDFTLQKMIDPKTYSNLPNLFCCIEFLESHIKSNQLHFCYDNEGNMIQENMTNVKESILVHFFSKSLEARQRKIEVVQAINSLFSQQQQELNQCRLFIIPDLLFSGKAARTREYSYIGNLEGGIVIYYFNIIIEAFTWYKKEKQVTSNDYYDGFGVKVYDKGKEIQDDTPIIQFEINE